MAKNNPRAKNASAEATASRKEASYIPSGRAMLMRIEIIHRLIKAVTPLSTHRVTNESLAAELGVSDSTVKLDLAMMKIFNAPIENDRSRRTKYYSDPNYELRPPLWLENEEALALLAAVRVAAYSRTFPVGRRLVSAWEKLKPLIAGARAFGPETLDAVFSTSGTAAGEAEAKHFAVLCEAINRRQEVRVTYRKLDEPAPEVRVVHPLHWYVRPDACLLIAHEPRIGKRRNFELIRVQAVEPTGNAFTPPADFDLKKYLAGAFGRFVGEAVHTVRVRIAREFVPRLRERPWQHEALIELQDGRAEAVFHVCHTGDLEQEVLRTGGQVQVLEPADVRERIRQAALRIAAAHEGELM